MYTTYIDLAQASLWAFEQSDPDLLERLLRKARRKTAKPRTDKPLRCKVCWRGIARREHQIAVRGSHIHRCTNPMGVTFLIGCFRAASGCLNTGEASAEFTWFQGYKWRIALCEGCKNHIGWAYRSCDGDDFYGLILNRLAAVD